MFILIGLPLLQKTQYMEICSCILSPVFWCKQSYGLSSYLKVQSNANHATGMKLFQPLNSMNSSIYEGTWFLHGKLILN